jgi:hypothetical protein
MKVPAAARLCGGGGGFGKLSIYGRFFDHCNYIIPFVRGFKRVIYLIME